MISHSVLRPWCDSPPASRRASPLFGALRALSLRRSARIAAEAVEGLSSATRIATEAVEEWLVAQPAEESPSGRPS